MSFGEITLALNKEGIYDYEYGYFLTPNLYTWPLNEEELNILWDIFQEINIVCNKLIDTFESEDIQGREDLQKAYDVVNKAYQENNHPTIKKLMEYIERAIELDTLVAFDL